MTETRSEFRRHEIMEVGHVTLDISISTTNGSTLIWVERWLLAVGDTRDEAVREAVERLTALVEALQQPSPAAIAAPKESR